MNCAAAAGYFTSRLHIVIIASQSDRLNSAVPCDLAERVDLALRSFETTGACWITFFLRMPAERREEAFRRLEQARVEFEEIGVKGRHLHARLSTTARSLDICLAIERVSRICTDVGAQLLAADLDEDAAIGSAAQVANLFCTS